MEELKTKPHVPVPLMTEWRSLTLLEGGACHERSTVVFEEDTIDANEKIIGKEYR